MVRFERSDGSDPWTRHSVKSVRFESCSSAIGAKPRFHQGTLKLQSDARVYLVQDYTHSSGVQYDWDSSHWPQHKYVRFDLRREPLEFTLDLSKVPCGCLACVCTPPPSRTNLHAGTAPRTHPL
jgi:hypothetical protein